MTSDHDRVDLDDLDAYRIDTSLRPWRPGTQVGRTVYADAEPGVPLVVGIAPG